VTKHNIKYQSPSPPNIVRLSDDKQVIFVEWPYSITKITGKIVGGSRPHLTCTKKKPWSLEIEMF
jgi:hypothetical protein